MRLPRREFLIASACLATGMSLRAAEPAKTGTLAGTITYKADPARKWRYQRYYVKGSKSGPLAEAVIALVGRNLSRAPSSDETPIATINQKDFRFLPETTAIQAGQQIRFTNSDPSTHNVSTTESLHPFDISLAFGQEATETFERAGGLRRPIVLGCRFHSQMRAWIYVLDHPYYQVTGADGAFRLTDIPPGEYRLELVHPAGELTAGRKVTITAGETATLNIELSPDDLRKPSTAK